MAGIYYRDFFPLVLKSGIFSSEYEELSLVVARANEWINQNAIQVLNVETLLIPDIQNAKDASDARFYIRGDSNYYWCQVVRVWYQL